MIDIKKIKKELLEAFNAAELPPGAIAKNDALDAVLHEYFNKQSHMPKELTFEAILNSLPIGQHDKEQSREKVKAILDKF